jgi:hypothetical protein
MAIDWPKTYEVLKDWGLPVITFIAGIWVQRLNDKRQDRIRLDDQAREDLRRKEKADTDRASEREARINRVVDVYVQGTIGGNRILNEDGAIKAGVLQLQDWTEARDFCIRATSRVTHSGDVPIPLGRRSRLKDEQLFVYFERFREARAAYGGSFDVDRLISELPQP